MERGHGAGEEVGEAGGRCQTGERKSEWRKAAKASQRTAKPIELYYWPTPNGFKISIMLEECGLPYTMIPVNISKGEQFKPDFLKISPNNRMPAIVDPDGPGGRPISIFESGAILQYLGRKTGKFYPRDERARVEVDQWLFWQMGGVGPMAGQVHHFRNYARGDADLCDQPLRQRGQPALRRDEHRGSRIATSSPANIRSPTWRCVGWVNGWRAAGPGHRRISQSQALARDHEGAPGGANAAWRSASSCAKAST